MVTLAYTTVLVLTVFCMALFDMYLHKVPLAKALYDLYHVEFGFGRWLLLLQLIVGFAASWRADRKRRRSKQTAQKQEPHEQQA